MKTSAAKFGALEVVLCVTQEGTGSDGVLSEQECCNGDFFFPLLNYIHPSIQYLPFSSHPFV